MVYRSVDKMDSNVKIGMFNPVLISAIIENECILQTYNVLLFAHPFIEEKSSVMLADATV